MSKSPIHGASSAGQTISPVGPVVKAVSLVVEGSTSPVVVSTVSLVVEESTSPVLVVSSAVVEGWRRWWARAGRCRYRGCRTR
jgi:hypothetical protein